MLAPEIFDLKVNVSELESANYGASRLQFEQQAPTRDVTGKAFYNGAIQFRFQTNGTKWFRPSRSYLRIRGSLSKADGITQLTTADGIAPNMGLAANLFQNMEFRINDKTVSRVSDFVPQVDALMTRLDKSGTWLNGIGNSINFWSDDFKTRQSDIVSNPINNPVYETTQRLELGFNGATTLTMVADTGLITFANGAPIPDVTTIFLPGDQIEIDIGGVIGTVRYHVSFAPSNVTLQVNNLQNIGFGAVTYPFRRIRSTNSNDGRKMINFEIIWRPPLSIFNIEQGLPSGKFELILNPQTSSAYQKYAIESIGASKNPNVSETDGVPTPGSEFKFKIADMYFYANTVEGARADDVTYLLDLKQTRCQPDIVGGYSFGQKNFDVSPSTYALTVAYQDGRIGSDTRISSSKFKAYNLAITEPQELKLNRFYISYAGQQFPSPDADPKFNGTTDNTVQRYVESQMFSDAYYDNSGPESIKEFHNRGSYYHFVVPRDGTDRSTRVTVSNSFDTNDPNDVANMRVLLFDHSRQTARIRVQDGRTIDVQLEDA